MSNYIKSKEYKNMKESLIEFLENAYIMDLKMGVPTIDVVRKVDKAIDTFAKKILKAKTLETE